MIFRNQGSLIKKSNSISDDELIDLYGLNSYEFTQTKKEEIFIPGFSKSLDTDENQIGVLLLRRVRDEAHRLALSFHRDKRSKRMNRSQLSQISGLGPSRIRELLEHFKSIDAIRIASKEDLSKVKGLGKNSVNDIYEYFNEL